MEEEVTLWLGIAGLGLQSTQQKLAFYPWMPAPTDPVGYPHPHQALSTLLLIVLNLWIHKHFVSGQILKMLSQSSKVCHINE